MSTESFIFATPNRVIPRTSPYFQQIFVSSLCRASVSVETDLVAHDVTQEHDMSRIDSQSVRTHRVMNLLDDRRSRRFDTEHFFDLHDVIRRGFESDDTCESTISGVRREGKTKLTICRHDFSQTHSLDEQLLLSIRLLLDDRSSESRNSLATNYSAFFQIDELITHFDNDTGKDSLEPEHSSMSASLVGRGVDMNLVDFSLDIDRLKNHRQRLERDREAGDVHSS